MIKNHTKCLPCKLNKVCLSPQAVLLQGTVSPWKQGSPSEAAAARGPEVTAAGDSVGHSFPPVFILLLGLSVEITNFIVMYSYLMSDIKVKVFSHLDEYMFEN